MSLIRDLKRGKLRAVAEEPAILVEPLESMYQGVPVYVDLTDMACEATDALPFGEECYLPPFRDAWMEWSDQAGGDLTIGVRVKETNGLELFSELPVGVRAVTLYIFSRPNLSLFTKKKEQWHNEVRLKAVTMVLMNAAGQQIQVDYPEYRALVNNFRPKEMKRHVQAATDDVVLAPTLGRPESREGAYSAMGVVGHAFTLMNCRNIALAPTLRPPKKKRRRPAPKGISWHKLVVVPSRAKSSGIFVGHGTGEPVTRQHLCRGHLKTYTADKPLFGKHVGRFWWFPHVRGDKKLGVVLKDYEVHSQ